MIIKFIDLYQWIKPEGNKKTARLKELMAKELNSNLTFIWCSRKIL